MPVVCLLKKRRTIMDKSEVTTRVVLLAILQKHDTALKEHPERSTEIVEQTISAIQDNAHNIHPRVTTATSPDPDTTPEAEKNA
jgi:hypothetical protein